MVLYIGNCEVGRPVRNLTKLIDFEGKLESGISRILI